MAELSFSRGFRRTAIAAVVVTYLLIVVGGIVRVSGSGEGCGAGGGADSWPLCHGRLVPPADLQTLIEFSHRLFATLSGIAVAAVLIWAVVAYRSHRPVLVGAIVAEVLWLLQIVLGALVIELRLPANVILVHLANAELVLAATAFVAVSAALAGRGRGVAWTAPGPAARLGVGLALATFILVLSGALVVDTGSSAACNGWPLCGSGGVGVSPPAHGADVVNVAHRFVAGVIVVLIGVLSPRILRARRGEPGVRGAFILVNVALLLQVLAGVFVVETRLQPWAQGSHVALATLLWVSVFTLALLARVRPVAQTQSVRSGNAASVPAT